MPGRKFYDRASAREMLRGLYGKDGHQINDTGYAPKYNEKGEVINDPDAYADSVRQYFRKYYRAKHNEDMDIEQIKIRDYTPEMQDVLEEAQEAQEKFREGTVRKYDATRRLVGNASSESFPDNAAASSGWSLGASAQADNPFVPDHGGRPNALGPIPPMWDSSALPIGPNRLAGDSSMNLPRASANPSFQYSPSGMTGPSSPAQPASAPIGYHTWPLPSDSPLFPRRNLLEPAGSLGPWGQPGSGGNGTPVPPGFNLLGPWPGSYPEGPTDLPQSGSRNVFGPWPGSYAAVGRAPDLDRLLEQYLDKYAPSGQTWPPG